MLMMAPCCSFPWIGLPAFIALSAIGTIDTTAESFRCWNELWTEHFWCTCCGNQFVGLSGDGYHLKLWLDKLSIDLCYMLFRQIVKVFLDATLGRVIN